MTNKTRKLNDFYVISESHENVMKITHLLNTLSSTIQLLLVKYQLFADFEITETLLYEYITDKQYKDIIQKLQELPQPIPEISKEFLKSVTIEGKKISTTISVPIIHITTFNDIPDNILSTITDTFKDYQYVINFILYDVFDNSSKISKQQMKKMNKIYKNVRSVPFSKSKDIPVSDAINTILQINKSKIKVK